MEGMLVPRATSRIEVRMGAELVLLSVMCCSKDKSCEQLGVSMLVTSQVPEHCQKVVKYGQILVFLGSRWLDLP